MSAPASPEALITLPNFSSVTPCRKLILPYVRPGERATDREARASYAHPGRRGRAWLRGSCQTVHGDRQVGACEAPGARALAISLHSPRRRHSPTALHLTTHGWWASTRSPQTHFRLPRLIPKRSSEAPPGPEGLGFVCAAINMKRVRQCVTIPTCSYSCAYR